MLTDIKQAELDAAEEVVFNKIWGGTELDATSKFILNALGIDINDYIKAFEDRLKPFMNEKGLVNGPLLRQAIAIKSPKVSEMIPQHDFRLKDIVEGVLSCF